MLTTETVNALQDLAARADAYREAAAALPQAVEQARRAGASWTSIAAMLGTSKQAAAQRFTPKRATPRPRLF